MTANQYRAALDKLGVPVVRAVDYFGVSRRQAQRFASGEAPVPKLVAAVVKMLASGKIGLEDLR